MQFKCACYCNQNPLSWVIWWITHNLAQQICILQWCFYPSVCFHRGSPPFRYNHIVSEPLGRSTYKERYLFLYRYRKQISFILQIIVGINYLLRCSRWKIIFPSTPHTLSQENKFAFFPYLSAYLYVYVSDGCVCDHYILNFCSEM